MGHERVPFDVGHWLNSIKLRRFRWSSTKSAIHVPLGKQHKYYETVILIFFNKKKEQRSSQTLYKTNRKTCLIFWKLKPYINFVFEFLTKKICPVLFIIKPNKNKSTASVIYSFKESLFRKYDSETKFYFQSMYINISTITRKATQKKEIECNQIFWNVPKVFRVILIYIYAIEEERVKFFFFNCACVSLLCWKKNCHFRILPMSLSLKIK